MNIHNWIFEWRYARKIKRQQQSPHKMKVQTDLLKSNCILEIHQETRKEFPALKQLAYKTNIKTIQNAAARIVRDEKGTETIKSNPVFSDNQRAEAKERTVYLITAIFFTIAEAALYYLVSALFLPGAKDLVKVTVAVFLALLNMLALDYGFSQHFRHLQLLEDSSVTPAQKKASNHKRMIGYALMLLSIGAIFYSGLARISFLENIDTTGLSPERIQSLHKASYFTSLFTMFVTMLTAIYMGVRKQEQAKHGHAYTLFRNWHKANVRHNSYNRQLIHAAEEIRSIIERRIEKYWQLTIRLKEMFLMDYEHDEKYCALDREYTALQAQPGFILSDAIYLKYAPLQAAHEELFKYGIARSPEIREKIDYAEGVLQQVEEHIKNHTPELIKNGKEETILFDAIKKPHLNGVANTIAIVLIALMVGFSSCTHIGSPPASKNVIGLVDISGSRDSSIIGWYCSILNSHVISSLAPADRITVLPIDYGSETYGTEVYAKDFSKNDYHNELAGLQSEAFESKRHWDSLAAACTCCSQALQAACSTRRSLAHGSDVIGALKLASKYRIEGDSNIIVIFSDMKQFTDKCHLNLEKPFSKRDIPSLMATMERADLRGMQVVVITGDQAALQQEQFEALKELWTAYVQQCGGRLVDYSSASTISLDAILRH